MTKTETPPSRPHKPSTASLQVARFRGALDWMIALPQWEDPLAGALEILGIKGKRQGISLRSALRSLPIEKKQELLRRTLVLGLPTPTHGQTRRLARLWGATRYRPRSDFGPPSLKEWQSLQQKVLIRIAARYEQYKGAQSDLFARYHHLAPEGAAAHCRVPSQREDACQEARLALLEAIDRVDPSERFEAYARQWIKRRVINFVMEERLPVKAPINLISKSLRGESGANRRLQTAIRDGALQLDHPLGHASERDRNLRSEPEQSPLRVAMQADEWACLQRALGSLTDKQREVIARRFGMGNHNSCQSLAQIAARVGISRQQVFQREKRALESLKRALDELASERQFQPVVF